MKLFYDLKEYKKGDLVNRTLLLNKIEQIASNFRFKEDKLSQIIILTWEYCDKCPFTMPIADIFHAFGLFLEALYNVNNDTRETRRKKLIQYYNKLNQLIGNNPESDAVVTTASGASEGLSSSGKTEFSFSRNDEENLDYSGIVSDEVVVETYVGEVEEFLDSAQVALLDLEHDEQNQEAINRVFRCFHTIKSSSAFLGMKNIEVLAHQMENMLGKVRSGELGIQSELIDVIFHGIGIIRDLNSLVRKYYRNPDDLIQGFKTFVLAPYIQLIEKITDEFKFRKLGEILKDMGSLDQGTLDDLLSKQKKDKRALGSIAVSEKIINEKELNTALKKQAVSKTKRSFVRVNSEKLNHLIDMVGELVVNQSMIRQKLNSESETLSGKDILPLDQVTTSIKNMVLNMGMVSLRELFQKLRIVVRNVSRELDKPVSLIVSGEDTEMDRSLVEAIYDPLVHMVRNSVSHGIEDSTKRSEAGKNVVGSITIDACYKGNGIEISVIDDGGGIDPEIIADKAIALGMMSQDQKESALKNKESLYAYLSKPGFSTQERADNISGRGVGMDVVMQNINQIKGKLEIESEVGKGSVFRIKLPLTLAIIDGFVTEIMNEYYVFPFESVEEILVSDAIDITDVKGDTSMGNYRGEHFPIIDLCRLLGDKEGNYEKKSVLIKIRHDDRLLAIPVNKVLGKQEIVIKNLNELIQHQKLFYGGTIFGDGSIGFVLDIDEIISQAGEVYGKKY